MATWSCRSHKAQHSFVVALSHFLIVVGIVIVVGAVIARVIRALDMFRHAWTDSSFITLIEMDLILTEDIWRTSGRLMLPMRALHVFLTRPVLLARSLSIAQLILVNVDILIEIYLYTISHIAKDSNLLWLQHASLGNHHLLLAIKVRSTWFNTIFEFLFREVDLVWWTTCAH